jgi:hypothetical protein
MREVSRNHVICPTQKRILRSVKNEITVLIAALHSFPAAKKHRSGWHSHICG